MILFDIDANGGLYVCIDEANKTYTHRWNGNKPFIRWLNNCGFWSIIEHQQISTFRYFQIVSSPPSAPSSSLLLRAYLACVSAKLPHLEIDKWSPRSKYMFGIHENSMLFFNISVAWHNIGAHAHRSATQFERNANVYNIIKPQILKHGIMCAPISFAKRASCRRQYNVIPVHYVYEASKLLYGNW